MNNNLQDIKWSENVILVDADYVDKVAFNLIVNFERMIGRRIPQADLAKWIDCVALDGGLREGEHETLVVLTHRKDKTKLENFVPADYAQELDGKAFKDHLGEFTIGAYPIEDIAGGEDYFTWKVYVPYLKYTRVNIVVKCFLRDSDLICVRCAYVVQGQSSSDERLDKVS